MALVLCAGTDPLLTKTRQLLLESAGHRVITATDEPAMISACKKHTFDVAVIGQGVPQELKRKMLSLLREYSPSTRVLEMYLASAGKTLETADAWLEASIPAPQDFANCVAALAREPRSIQGKG